MKKRTLYSKKSFENISKRFSDQISITSKTGVGKTSLISALKKVLTSHEFISAGTIMRKMAKELKFPTVEDFARYNREHPKEGYDLQCDKEIFRYCRNRNSLVGEGRLVHIFMPYAFHIYLECDLLIRSKRRSKDEPRGNYHKVLGKILDRDVDDELRYEELYPGCIWDKKEFDLVLSTEHLSPEEVAAQVIEGHKDWLHKLETDRKVICYGNK